MLVFEIYKNGKIIARSGRSDMCVMSAHLTAVGVLGPDSKGTPAEREDMKISFETGGVITDGIKSSKGTHPLGNLSWLTTRPEIGDEITIKLIESETADEPNWPSQEEVERVTKSHEDSERLWFERTKKEYLRLKDKYEK